MNPLKRMKRMGEVLFDLAMPGPFDGRSGALRRQILELEEQKRDRNLSQLFGIHSRSPAPSAWVALGTIAYEIVKHFKPRKIVELGSFGGFSTCVMALALREVGEGGRIYAVDTWEGDEDTGPYTEEVYAAFLSAREELELTDIIVPMRMTFEQASREIEPGINLLHIDGWHTYEAVARDFKLFKLLLAPHAHIMFHDVYSFFRGMRFFWYLTSWCYPSYLIPYGHGLGIIQMP